MATKWVDGAPVDTESNIGQIPEHVQEFIRAEVEACWNRLLTSKIPEPPGGLFSDGDNI